MVTKKISIRKNSNLKHKQKTEKNHCSFKNKNNVLPNHFKRMVPKRHFMYFHNLPKRQLV